MHFLKDFVLVDGVAILRLAVVREMGSDTGCEARVEPTNKRLAYADRKGLLVHERVGGSKYLGVIVIHRREDGVALRVLVCLPDMVKGGMRLL